VLEIAVLDALGLENSVARSRTLIAGALAAAKLLEAEQIESFAISIEDDGCHDQAVVSVAWRRCGGSCPGRTGPHDPGRDPHAQTPSTRSSYQVTLGAPDSRWGTLLMEVTTLAGWTGHTSSHPSRSGERSRINAALARAYAGHGEGVLVASDAALLLLGDVRGLMNPAQLSL